MTDDLLDTADLALRLGTSPQRVSGMLARNPDRYRAYKVKGTGKPPTPYRWRWLVPAAAVALLRADLKG